MTMDVRLKERLVGATVLVFAAVLFIPMVLDGPDSDRQVSHRVELPDPAAPARRTVRIALDSAQEPAAETGAARKLPEPDVNEPATVDLTPGQTAARNVPDEQPAVTIAKKPAERAPAQAAGDTRAPWTVQVGSFSQNDNAEALAAKLRTLEYPAYVSRFNDGTRVHYRVRVGGFPSRDAAQIRAEEIRTRTGEPASPVQNR